MGPTDAGFPGPGRDASARRRGFAVRPIPPLTQREGRRLRRWLRSVAADEALLTGRPSLGRGVLRIGTDDRRRAEALARLAGAAIGRYPFTYTLIREPDAGPARRPQQRPWPGAASRTRSRPTS
jgi:hypothetical protein